MTDNMIRYSLTRDDHEYRAYFRRKICKTLIEQGSMPYARLIEKIHAHHSKGDLAVCDQVTRGLMADGILKPTGRDMCVTDEGYSRAQEYANSSPITWAQLERSRRI